MIPLQSIITDAGRSKSKRPRQYNDCTVRSLSLVCNLEYDVVYDILKKAGRQSNDGFDYRPFFRKRGVKGFKFEWVSTKEHTDIGTFLTSCSDSVVYIVNTYDHVFPVIKGIIYDLPETFVNFNEHIYGYWLVKRVK